MSRIDRVTFNGAFATRDIDLISLDPGASCGVALWSQGALQWLGRLGEAPAVIHECRAIVERPTAYPGSKVPVKDIVTLAYRAGLQIGQLAPRATVESVEPRTWKGSLPKHVTHRRAWSVLKSPEKAIVRAYVTGLKNYYPNDELDALTLGLWYLGRWAP